MFLAQLSKQEGGRSSLSGGFLHAELGFLDLGSGVCNLQGKLGGIQAAEKRGAGSCRLRVHGSEALGVFLQTASG